jgi:hypothetical protein
MFRDVFDFQERNNIYLQNTEERTTRRVKTDKKKCSEEHLVVCFPLIYNSEEQKR